MTRRDNCCLSAYHYLFKR